MNGTPDYLLETTCLPWSALSVRLQFVRRCCLRPSRLDFRRRSLRKKLAGGAALNETQDLHSAWVGGAARWGGLVIGMFYTPAVHDEPFGSDVRISNGRQRLFRPEDSQATTNSRELPVTEGQFSVLLSNRAKLDLRPLRP
jgi:hypothetical protein